MCNKKEEYIHYKKGECNFQSMSSVPFANQSQIAQCYNMTGKCLW